MRDLLRASERMGQLGDADRRLAFRLCMGETATEALLDELIDAHVRRPSSLEPVVRDALRLACHELCWLDTPAPVAVSQGVELVRTAAPRAVGMANAVLHRIAEEERPRVEAARRRCEALVAAHGADGLAGDPPCTVRDLVLASGMPAWLARRLVGDRGMCGAAYLAVGCLEPAPVSVVANRARHDVPEARELLAAAGLEPREDSLPGAFVLGRPAGLVRSGLVEAADVAVADRASQAVACALAPAPGSHVLEVGQGRGTKTILLESVACAAGGLARVSAVDSEAFKVRLSEERMRRAGLSDWVSCHVADGRALGADGLPTSLSGAFDLVFLDAPCSGTGTMRRHPEIAATLDEALTVPGGVGSLSDLQLQLLRAAAARVAPGGTLAYATCSALRSEDEDVVDRFLASEEGSRFVAVTATSRLAGHAPDGCADALAPWVTPDGFLLTGITESPVGTADTHFLALLEAR